MPGRHFLRSDIFTIAIVGDSFFRLFPKLRKQILHAFQAN